MDAQREQTPKEWPTGPEQVPPPAPKPEIGSKRDLVRPEQPEAEPKKPMPDMDPEGQDPDENETIQGSVVLICCPDVTSWVRAAVAY